MKSQATGSKLLRGAFILSAAALLSKLIGTLQKIPLQNLGGDAVFGIYNTVYPIYTLLVTVAMLGLPAAVSKAVAETVAGGSPGEGRTVLLRAGLVSGVAGLLLAAGTYAGAPLIAGFIGSGHVAAALRAAAWGLAIVPVMAAFRGYFQGLHNMMPTAVSQIFEQSARVAVMIALLLFLSSRGAGAELIAAGALLGSAGGGIAGLAVMLLYWRNHRRLREDAAAEISAGAEAAPLSPEAPLHAPSPAIRRTNGSSIRKLLAYGLPVMLGTLAAPLISLVDVFTMPRLLASAGGEAQAMVQFGIYNRGVPLVQLVTMLAGSLSALFIPALAESKFRGNLSEVESRCRLSLRWFWLLGLAAAAGLAVLAVPVNIALYGDASGSGTIRWLAFTAAGGTVSIISAALLQGLGLRPCPGAALPGRRCAEGGPQPAARPAAGHCRRGHRRRRRAGARSRAERAAAVQGRRSAASPRRLAGAARGAARGPGGGRRSRKLRLRGPAGRGRNRRPRGGAGAEPARRGRRLPRLCRAGRAAAAAGRGRAAPAPRARSEARPGDPEAGPVPVRLPGPESLNENLLLQV
ncbi:membrane protein [Paenibacillus sabinae T27]|uniref:Membrane protein n=1 Tax=Paenibacillus sabinae T27 TaxID=1268072 RepID=X4Z5D4_9BACL|nr:membrane protein [Paenibacillus sabinae T27]